MCLAGSIIASFFTVMANIFVTEFSENILEKLKYSLQSLTDSREINDTLNLHNLIS